MPLLFTLLLTLLSPGDNWVVELEKPGNLAFSRNRIEIDVHAGATIWWKQELNSPVQIEYEATMIARGGANDRVSDLNCFWMAADALATPRSGKFADYDTLKTYYVGYGGNSNTTTRFRRYIGRPGERPLLPEHNLTAPELLLKPNVAMKIRLVADGHRIQYWRDGKLVFDFNDPDPYTRGYFGFRTTQSHIVIRNFKVRLKG